MSNLQSPGINFRLDDEQLQIQEVARKFTRDEIIPVAAHHDRTGEYPNDVLRKAWSLGLLNKYVPEEFGGAGLGCLTGCVVAEEFAYGCTGIMSAMIVSEIGVSRIDVYDFVFLVIFFVVVNLCSKFLLY